MAGFLRQWLKGRVDGLLRSAFSGMARPLHVSAGTGPCLILAPHPDDESLGCGHLIERMVARGRRVHVVIAADGSGCRLGQFRPREEVVAIRRAEALAACAALGVPADSVEFLSVPDGTLAQCKDEVVRKLSGIVSALAPASVFAPFIGEAHPDHAALAEAVRVLQASGVLHAALFEYPIWLPTKTAARLLASPRFRRSLRTLAGQSGAAKRRAIAAYRSQETEYEGQRIDGALSPEFVDLFLAHREVYFGPGYEA
jgi:LmbE family N-acetylglucosaminyl deacetylase